MQLNAEVFSRQKKSHSSEWLFLNLGAGNETRTRALSHCFPSTFFASVISEGLHYSLVFFPWQQSSSKDFHQWSKTAIHAIATDAEPLLQKPLPRRRRRVLASLRQQQGRALRPCNAAARRRGLVAFRWNRSVPDTAIGTLEAQCIHHGVQLAYLGRSSMRVPRSRRDRCDGGDDGASNGLIAAETTRCVTSLRGCGGLSFSCISINHSAPSTLRLRLPFGGRARSLNRSCRRMYSQAT